MPVSEPSYVEPQWSTMETVNGDLFVPRDEARAKLAAAGAEVERLREAHHEAYRLRAIMEEASKQDAVTCRKWIRDALNAS